MDELRTSEEAGDGAVEQVNFVSHRGARDVPSVVWRPRDRSAVPVVLVGHGGSGHKRSERNMRLAARFARAGIASLAIDGPFHGDRAIDGDGPLDYQERVVNEDARTVHDRMCQDWLGALAAAVDTGWVDGQKVAFFGLSMGARYGVLACAALSSRLRCAVLGKFGLSQTDKLPPGLAANDAIIAAAESIRAPILQHVQWHDEIFPLQGQLDLFDLYPSPDKQLRGRPGNHASDRPDDEIAWCEYVTTHLNRQDRSERTGTEANP
jgi:dienelactone hydrolase